MGKKLSISEKLAKRKYKKPSRFIYTIYKTIMLDMVAKKYKPKFNIIDDVNDCDGPCFVIFNHLSRIDHAYVMGATYPRVTNMMAGCNEFYRTKFSFIFGLNKVIPKKQYTADTLPIRAVSKIIKQGGWARAESANLPPRFIHQIFREIHEESVRQQINIREEQK